VKFSILRSTCFFGTKRDRFSLFKKFSMKPIHPTYDLCSREIGNLRLSIHNNPKVKSFSGKILAADIGGTNTRMALFIVEKGILRLLAERNFKTRSYANFREILNIFHPEPLKDVDCICLGVAGPVQKGRVKGTNFSWELDQLELSRITGVERIIIINDMEAHAYGLGITTNYFEIKKGSNIPGNAAIISPGTGLGEAGLFRDNNFYHPFSTEGGHCDFSPRDELDIELLRYLQATNIHVSWERIVSGPGIYNIYNFLKEYRKVDDPEGFTERIKDQHPSVVISEYSKEGTSPLCTEVMDLFLKYLAIEAAQLSLKFKAMGGIFIGGGILPNIVQIVDRKKFTNHFINSGPMDSLLFQIPIKVILQQNTAIYGAAIYAVMKMIRLKS
jgi:glucokinase